MAILRLLALGLVVIACGFAHGQVEHKLIRRITVFPMKAPKDQSAAADEAWWTVREALTENQRFLVASRNFLIQRDVFQSREELKPADAVILGKLLDANALVTLFLEGRTLSMRVYESEYGRLLWTHDFNLHPSQPISDQLVGAARKLIYDFVASIPYQGFVVIDPLKRTAVFKDGERLLARVNLGLTGAVQVGDPVQFIHLYHDTVRPLFTPENNPEVFGDGKVLLIEHDTVTVEILRFAKSSGINEFTLVRFPQELQRLRSMYALSQSAKNTIGTEYFSPEITAVQQDVAERKPLVTTLTFILNMAAFLLLAF